MNDDYPLYTEPQQFKQDRVNADMNQTNQEQEKQGQHTPQADLPWDHPKKWEGIAIGQCVICKTRQVLRFNVCWTCEHPAEGRSE